MPRKLFTTALATFALLVGGLVLSAPAQAEWTRPGDLTKYRLCKASTDGGDSWRFVSKVRKRAGTPDARAGIDVFVADKRKAHWSSGWLEKGETQISTVRVKKSPKVRVQIWQEAGDLDSPIGTALEMNVLKPHKIRHC
ncbi:MAG: hypothetical protein WKF50_06575 [Nocardioides sp.]